MKEIELTIEVKMKCQECGRPFWDNVPLKRIINKQPFTTDCSTCYAPLYIDFEKELSVFNVCTEETAEKEGTN